MIKEWTLNAVQHRLICKDYAARIQAAATKRDYFRILCDANGISFVGELQKKGLLLPLQEFKEEFKPFVNGAQIIRYDNGVTSKLYIDYNDNIIADTTLMSIINCKCVIDIPNYHYPRIVIDQNSDVIINIGTGVRATIDIFDGGKCSMNGDKTNIKINKL